MNPIGECGFGRRWISLFGQVWWPQESQACAGMGNVLGCGVLMMDRLTVGFFLVPAVLPLLRGRTARYGRMSGLNLHSDGWIDFVAYYREFVIHHLGELLPQVVQGRNRQRR